MREILFKGKTKEGEWVYGNYEYYHKPEKHIISNIYDNTTKGVIPETVGQYTGLTDKNGKKIFEGDIIRFNNQVGSIVYERGCFGIGIDKAIRYKRFEDYVEEKTNNCYSGVRNDNFISLFEIYWNCNNENNQIDEIEIIGNIHDNPELLGE